MRLSLKHVSRAKSAPGKHQLFFPFFFFLLNSKTFWLVFEARNLPPKEAKRGNVCLCNNFPSLVSVLRIIRNCYSQRKRLFKCLFFFIVPDNVPSPILFPGPFARGSYALIYKWSGTRFEVFHRLPTGERAYGVKALSVDNTHFLAVARWNADSSLIFRWNGTQFEPFQEVPSKRVSDLLKISSNFVDLLLEHVSSC